MAQLIIPDVEEGVLERLREQAKINGRTAETEAGVILAGVLQPPRADVWPQVNAFRQQLAASGRRFGDSTDQLREDRER